MRTLLGIPLYFDDAAEVKDVHDTLQQMIREYPAGRRAFYTKYPAVMHLTNALSDMVLQEEQ